MKKYPLALSLLLPLLTFSQECEVSYKALEEGKIAVLAKNTAIFPYTVKLEANLKGMKSTAKLPVVKVIEAKRMDTLAIFFPEEGLKYSFGYNTTITEGNILARHNDSHVYDLPYKTGTAYKIDQGYQGRSTHMGKNALDFHMDEGTEICAIRDGLVVKAIDNNKKGCPEEHCADFNNYVLVLHEDGSYADYSHLQKDGALVDVGDQVSAGQVIGLSGKTGIASGPHLHLEVYTMTWEGQHSIAVKYQIDGKATLPVEGMKYLKEE